jgi:hypothetical protein
LTKSTTSKREIIIIHIIEHILTLLAHLEVDIDIDDSPDWEHDD